MQPISSMEGAMSRKILILLSTTIATVTLISAAWAYQVPDTIILDRPGENTPLNQWVGKVKFLHGFHAIRTPCKQCHHKETDKTLGEFVGCRQCHTDDNPNDKSGFYRAWHSDGPPSCLGCHTQLRTRGGKNPVGCTTACHKRN